MGAQNNQRKISVIQPRSNLLYSVSSEEYRKKQVAAYARVSTDEDEQLSSYEAQVDYYTRHITSNPEWEFVSVYADEGISGTNTKKRDGFNRMIDDALDGKIDLILTKSISRFARNTVDTLTTVRKLKEKNIEVYFEKENIYTLDSKGELFITIMSSIAQEESRSISENVTWGKRKSMEDGKISLPYKNFLGYRKGEDGLPEIVEEEAEIIRLIYRMFLEGNTCRNIARQLTELGIPTPCGKKKWGIQTVRSILTNEKMKGSALLQKSYTIDFLSKKVKKNEGELKQVYIENSHPAIIPPDTFDLVQSEFRRRYPIRRQLNNNSIFSAKIICGGCGGFYGSKFKHADTSRVWNCNKLSDDTLKHTPPVNDNEIKAAFVAAFNQILSDKGQYIARFEKILPLLADSSRLEKRLEEATTEWDARVGRLHHYVEENARKIQDQDEYNRHLRELRGDCAAAEKRIIKIKDELQELGARREKIRLFLGELKKAGNIMVDFDESLWHTIAESVTVNPNKTLTFLFRDGSEVSVTIPNTK